MTEYILSKEQLELFHAFIIPAIFDLGYDECRFAGMGTVFIGQYGDSYYAITARHVIENQTSDSTTLRLFLRNYGFSIPFDREASFPYDGELRHDLAIFRVSMDQLRENQPPDMRALNIGIFAAPELEFPDDSLFLVIGFPQCRREYDYDNNRFVAGITVIQGSYDGTLEDGVATITVNYDHLDNIRGLSGSPVMCIYKGVPFFAGMAILSTIQSNKIHFIHATVIWNALRKMHEN